MNLLINHWQRLLVLLALSLPLVALAKETPLSDKHKEKRAEALFKIVQCPVCNGQSVAESDTPISKLIRLEIRELVSEGKSDQDIIAILQSKYLIKVQNSYYYVYLYLLVGLVFSGVIAIIWRRYKWNERALD